MAKHFNQLIFTGGAERRSAYQPPECTFLELDMSEHTLYVVASTYVSDQEADEFSAPELRELKSPIWEEDWSHEAALEQWR